MNEYIQAILKYTRVGSIIKKHIDIIREYSIRRVVLSVASTIIEGDIDKSVDLGVLFDNVQNKANLIELTCKNRNLMYISDILKEINHDF
ncbi:hypothetical protein [Borreliella garinii]|uniref:hypothetical protein n=1 Tax=Borreliella garinii TaxID=29519 RepID=UPI0004116CBD|nr:hypothetical protein [Borreliella garinii]